MTTDPCCGGSLPRRTDVSGAPREDERRDLDPYIVVHHTRGTESDAWMAFCF